MGGRGTGGGAAPINYLLGENRDREGARLLRGHPDRTVMLIDSLEFRQKYVSGVLSFEESDIPEDQKQQIMDSFQQMLMPKMGERTNWLWVEHRDKGRLELNFVIPTVDLETGKRVQPYYHRTDLNRVDAWKSLTNDLYRFTDPNDPAKAQTITLRTNESADRKSFKRTIDDYASQLFATGQINNRDELITAVEQHGLTATRKSKEYVTFTHNENGQKFRMKGAFYGEHFRSREAIQSADNSRDRETDKVRDGRISANRKRLREAMGIKLADIERRYIQPRTGTKNGAKKEHRDINRATGKEPAVIERNDEVHSDIESDSPFLIGTSGGRLDIILERHNPPESIPKFDDRTLRLWEHVVLRMGTIRSGREDPTTESATNGENVNDRDREIIAGRIGAAIELNEGISEAIDGTIRDIRSQQRAAHKGRTQQHINRVGRSAEESEQAIRRIREIAQQNGRVTQEVAERARAIAERARALADRAGENYRAIEHNHRRHKELLESVRERVAEQKRANRPTVSRGYRR
jgi:hypothetical protein